MNVGAVVGDEDSSTMAAVRQNPTKNVRKFADKMHAARNFGKELYIMSVSCKELSKKDAIKH